MKAGEYSVYLIPYTVCPEFISATVDPRKDVNSAATLALQLLRFRGLQRRRSYTGLET